MTKTLLTAVSALAIIAATPAIADTERTENQHKIETVTESDIEQGWDNTKNTVSNAAEDISGAAGKAWEDAKDAVTPETTAEMEMEIETESNFVLTKDATININQRATAQGMLGKPVYNANGERVAKVRDIILNGNGNAQIVVLGDGDFTGLGKLAAFDYSLITQKNTDGDIIAALSEDMIDTAAPFSYDATTSTDTRTRIMPSNGYSVTQILDAKLKAKNGDTLAIVDNITFRNGNADRLIVSFGEILGLGGEKAALDFNKVNMNHTPEGDGVDFTLSQSHEAEFKNYKNTALD